MKTNRKKKSFFARLSEASQYVFQAGMYRNGKPDPSNLWSGASFDSINAENSHWTRETLIARARQVAANNSFASNGISCIQNAVVGSSPRIQITSKTLSGDELARMESDWNKWAGEIHLGEKLRQMIFARVVDGEAFAQFCLNNRLSNDVKLDLFLFDSMRVTNQEYAVTDFTDGIKVDSHGNPLSYRILKRHPNENGTREYVDVKASQIAHLFKRKYPEQRRGVTELQPALDLFNLLDRYSRATVRAAETAACLALVFHTDQAEDFAFQDEPSSAGKPFAEMSWSQGQTVTLPEGWNVSQIRAEQPVSSYSPYMSSLLNQIGAAIGVPKILLQASAEQSNYSSARLDIQTFTAQCRVDREQLVQVVLQPLFKYWLKEYATVRNKAYNVNVQFYFDQYILIDPQKEAAASKVMLDSNLTTLAYEYAKRGIDWEEALKQRAREKELMYQLKLMEDSNGTSSGRGNAIVV